MNEDKGITIKIPTEKQLELFIRDEEKIRMSKEYSDQCTSVKDIPNGWLKVSEQVQIDIVKKYGFTDSISCDIACNKLRRAQYLYPDNPVFKTPVYVRENKACVGTLKEGDSAPDVTLYKRSGESIKLHQIFSDKVNVIFAGSHT